MACDICPCLFCPIHSFKECTLADDFGIPVITNLELKLLYSRPDIPTALWMAQAVYPLVKDAFFFPICPFPSCVNGSSIHLDL